eukprot:6082174-Amphidinium_carterae.1
MVHLTAGRYWQPVWLAKGQRCPPEEFQLGIQVAGGAGGVTQPASRFVQSCSQVSTRLTLQLPHKACCPGGRIVLNAGAVLLGQ